MTSPDPQTLYYMRIAYDGTCYGGWQTQHNASSIQATIEKALAIILGQPIQIVGSGRTDAGVHALGQVAHFYARTTQPTPKILASLNGILPKDIRILDLNILEEPFHARYSATAKVYHYQLALTPVADPLTRRYTYHVPHPVDITLLKTGAMHFIGTHDFTSFTNKAIPGKNNVRTLYRLDVFETDLIRLELEGNGFLYKMVRNIVGTLLDVARGKISVEMLPTILEKKERKYAGRSAPPHGLFLAEVKY